jgi:hypothetical protein
MLIPVAARSKAWFLRLFACWVCGFESGLGHGCLSLVSVVCCQVEVSASGWSLVQRSPTECGASEYDREASTMRRPWPTGGCWAMEENRLYVDYRLWGITYRHRLFRGFSFSVCLGEYCLLIAYRFNKAFIKKLVIAQLALQFHTFFWNRVFIMSLSLYPIVIHVNLMRIPTV